MTEGGEHRAPGQRLLTRINLSEPVRLRLYAVTAAGVGLLAGYGLLGADRAGLWLALAAAVLFGGGGVAEWVRAAVVSPVTARNIAVDAARERDRGDLHPLTAAGLALNWNGVPGS